MAATAFPGRLPGRSPAGDALRTGDQAAKHARKVVIGTWCSRRYWIDCTAQLRTTPLSTSSLELGVVPLDDKAGSSGAIFEFTVGFANEGEVQLKILRFFHVSDSALFGCLIKVCPSLPRRAAGDKARTGPLVL